MLIDAVSVWPPLCWVTRFRGVAVTAHGLEHCRFGATSDVPNGMVADSTHGCVGRVVGLS